MQFVFVHGVNAPRVANDYAPIAKRVENNLDRFCFDKTGTNVEYQFPFWGGNGVPNKHLYRSIPRRGDGDVAFGLATENLPNGTLEGSTLLVNARQNFDATLNDISIALLAMHDSDENAVRTAQAIPAYIANSPEIERSEWLKDVETDEQFIAKLSNDLEDFITEEDVAFGLKGKIKKALGKVAMKIVGVIDEPVVTAVRKGLSPTIAVFLGDAMVYLAKGAAYTHIRQTVSTAILESATAAKSKNEKLVLCGHSMGANILFDLVFDPDNRSELENSLQDILDIELFLGVGCQYGLLREMQVFNFLTAGQVVEKPAAVKNWWHVYNHDDVLSFKLVKDAFSGAENFSVDTKASIIEAHGAYFHSPLFFDRLRKRMTGAGVL